MLSHPSLEMIRLLTDLGLSRSSQRGQSQRCDCSCWVGKGKRERCLSGIQMLQPRHCITQSDAHSEPGSLIRGWCYRSIRADAVPQNEFQVTVDAAGGDLDPPLLPRTGDAMANRILHQGLENQLRHQQGQSFRIGLQLHRESWTETHFFEIKILVHELEFLAKG